MILSTFHNVCMSFACAYEWLVPEIRWKNNMNNNYDKWAIAVTAKLIPPSCPKVTQLSDTSVMLRWKVPNNDGLSVMFFKVQYKEMTADKRRRRWHTIDEDILSPARMYEVSGLRPGQLTDSDASLVV